MFYSLFSSLALALLASFISTASSSASSYKVKVVSRDVKPLLSEIDQTSAYSLIFNPSWIEASTGTNGVSGLIMRTQNCTLNPGDDCSFCGGSEAKASILTFSSASDDGSFEYVNADSVVFGPSDESDSWGTEDPRVQYNAKDGLYYMFYTAYNGKDILLNLATSPNPTASSSWTRHGPVFPSIQGSKSGALLIRESGPHYLYWGDSSIKLAQSDDLTAWPESGGEVFLEVRADNFDSKLVESGPPPIQLSSGDYIFFYNSASLGWPDEPGSAYHPGYVILDGQDPSIIKERCEVPLLTPTLSWELGVEPYTCNVPNVIFLEAAHKINKDVVTESGLKKDFIKVYYGGADAVIGSAVIEVSLAHSDSTH